MILAVYANFNCCVDCRVHDLRSMRQVAFLEAHDAEVLCLEFTTPASGKMWIVVITSAE